jgi:molybdopterin converting factor small subunit
MRAKPQNFLIHGEHGCQRSLNMQIQTSHSTLNVLTVERLLAELEERFPLTNPQPGAHLDQIMYRAGQRSVVDWVASRLSEGD